MTREFNIHHESVNILNKLYSEKFQNLYKIHDTQLIFQNIPSDNLQFIPKKL